MIFLQLHFTSFVHHQASSSSPVQPFSQAKNPSTPPNKMQFSIISIITLLATVASAAPVVEDVQVMRTVDARDTSVSAGSKLVARQGSNDLSALDIFASGSCNNYQTTVFVSIPGGGPGSSNGKCFTLGSNASVRTTFLRGSCTLTVYTDSNCSNGATASRVGTCLTRNWKSFSVDNCS
ncbi:hypothetical protein MGG_05747 [Pyricularia oryzae 70-15]|uniref:Uncharacterized protein n=2 Tax=Pyricularia TaxID=48558 RepID=G4MPW3_PYRO7|nr:uncharacterized protein MGG_05747 [Pyricularia oryzae 70-15]EHA58051.1 hypothetical protein MGG_05747 [Pyricularia oryzae 70-15]